MLKVILKDDLLRTGYDTYRADVEEELLENDEIYLNGKKESENNMDILLDILEEKEHKKILIDFEEKIFSNSVIEKEYAYRMGVLDGLGLAEFIDLAKKLCLKRN